MKPKGFGNHLRRKHTIAQARIKGVYRWEVEIMGSHVLYQGYTVYSQYFIRKKNTHASLPGYAAVVWYVYLQCTSTLYLPGMTHICLAGVTTRINGARGLFQPFPTPKTILLIRSVVVLVLILVVHSRTWTVRVLSILCVLSPGVGAVMKGFETWGNVVWRLKNVRKHPWARTNSSYVRVWRMYVEQTAIVS